MNTNPITKAVIYCRVSADKQVKEGHGLDSQKIRCIQYAAGLGCKVAKTFRDEGVSGAKGNRPGFSALLSYIDNHPDDDFTVVIDDPSRLAKDMQVHLTLRDCLRKRKVRIVSPNFVFDESPEGLLVENITAAVNQYGREQNARQVKQKMKARMDLGCWSLRSPALGLVYKLDRVHGKILANNEPYTSILKEAIEKYAADYLNTFEETRAFIQSKYIEKGMPDTISSTGAQNVLTELLYTGWLEYKPWNVTLRKGVHEGFISLDTYKIVQAKIAGKSKPRSRKDFNIDFPLRGYVLCDACGRLMTASWNKGRSKHYPNYWCKNMACLLRNKTVQRQVIESEFKQLLCQVKPNDFILSVMKDVLSDVWRSSIENSELMNKKNEKKIAAIEPQMSRLMARASKTDDGQLATMYETEAKRLLSEIDRLKAPVRKPEYSEKQFGTACESVFNILKRPVETWNDGKYEMKRTVLYMYFEAPLRYRRGSGFGTTALSCPIALMSGSTTDKNDLVEMPGVEPGCKGVSLLVL